MRARQLLSAAAALIAAATVHAQEGNPPLRFAYERPVITTGPGAQRLAIDVPLLAGGRPMTVVSRGDQRWPRALGGLSDLRFFAPDGRPVPHLIVHAPEAEPAWISGSVLPVAATKETSGFEADFGAATSIDMVRVVGLPAPFLKRLALEGSGDRERWTMLAPEATLFDLPDEQLRQTALGFPGGPYRFVRVTWNDRNSGRLPMPRSVVARRVSTFPPAPVAAPISVEVRPSEPGRSRYRLKLPGAHLPIVALDLDVAGGHVLRQAVVSESRLSGLEAAPAELGRQTITRVVRDGVAAAALRISITPPREAELELTGETSVPELKASGNRSVYRVPLPFANLPGATLVLETSARVFSRQVQAGVERSSDQQRREASFDVLASASWRHADQQTPSPALALALPRTDATVLTVVVDEGDNSALPMTDARLLLPSYRLRFFTTTDPLRLLYGREDVPAPQYDLALLAPQVMGAEAREIGLAGEPASTASGQASFVSPRVFWILLAGAVVVLLALIARLTR
ncbi:MAG: DUF3999 domain-containing protein [Acidobacteria bacterium]|nr:DUF3999 domain-containing protein [Acidobacteriota bacterium]